jgi:uncharacterized integral membrane protein (TIGR00698 family)
MTVRTAPAQTRNEQREERPARAVWWPGLAASIAIAVVATVAGKLVPVLGPAVCGIAGGVVISAVLLRDRRSARVRRLQPGLNLAGKHVLQLAVVLLGAQLQLTQVARTGLRSLPVMLGTLAACLIAASVLGRAMKIGTDLRTLIGVGTGICGASAIAAVTPVIAAAEADVAYAISTIFLFNIAAVLTFPLLGHMLGLSQRSFALFSGTAVNDMSSVVATSTAYGAQAARQAVIVKLTRTLLIIPVSIGLAAHSGGRTGGSGVVRMVPWFLIGFLAASVTETTGLIPAWAHAPLNDLAVFLITVALTAIGLSADLRGLRRAGPRPLLLGACLWVLVSATSLSLQAAFGMT